MDRSTQRRGFDVATRLALVESDLDLIEAGIALQTQGIYLRLDKLIETSDKEVSILRKSLASNQRLLIGMLCSLVVASAMMALNMAVI